MRGALFSFVVVSSLLAPRARGVEVALSAVALHLPDSSYHYFASSIGARFGDPERSGVFAEFGMTPPFSRYGYTQTILFLSAGWEERAKLASFARAFAGLGVGVFADEVSGGQGIVPSLVTRAGVSIGTPAVGLVVAIEGYLGIYSLPQLFKWTAWPLTNFTGGIYVAL